MRISGRGIRQFLYFVDVFQGEQSIGFQENLNVLITQVTQKCDTKMFSASVLYSF